MPLRGLPSGPENDPVPVRNLLDERAYAVRRGIASRR
jgi:hypothetical protein